MSSVSFKISKKPSKLTHMSVETRDSAGILDRARLGARPVLARFSKLWRTGLCVGLLERNMIMQTESHMNLTLGAFLVAQLGGSWCFQLIHLPMQIPKTVREQSENKTKRKREEEQERTKEREREREREEKGQHRSRQHPSLFSPRRRPLHHSTLSRMPKPITIANTTLLLS